MAKASHEPASHRLHLGWGELQEGRWEAARALFEQAAAAAETPEAFEGLSWAAWWLDDAETVFASRERSYRLYEAAGDVASAARMATWLASDQLDFHGAFAVAGGWVGRAHRLLDPVEEGPEHGWLAFLEGYMAHAGGQAARAAELGRRSAEFGRRFTVPDLEMLGLALEGATLVACAQVEQGMRCLDEATATALQGRATVPISGAWACCFLVTACTAVGDYQRAFEWCDRIAEFAERYGSRYMLAFCRAEYGMVHLWRGRWAEAEALLEASVEDFARSRPAMVGGSLVGMAERKLGRAPGLELLARARTARGELEEAGAALAALREIEVAVGTEPLRACVDLAQGLLAAARGDHGRARPLLEDATDGFERSGGLFEAARARIELATTLVALGRTDVAQREATAAVDQLRQLGAEAEAQRGRRLLEELGAHVAGPPLPQLTPREGEVLRLVAEGLTNRQIAERLVVSEHTVHRHVTNMLRKLGLPSRTAAAGLAARLGLLEPSRT